MPKAELLILLTLNLLTFLSTYAGGNFILNLLRIKTELVFTPLSFIYRRKSISKFCPEHIFRSQGPSLHLRCYHLNHLHRFSLGNIGKQQESPLFILLSLCCVLNSATIESVKIMFEHTIPLFEAFQGLSTSLRNKARVLTITFKASRIGVCQILFLPHLLPVSPFLLCSLLPPWSR